MVTASLGSCRVINLFRGDIKMAMSFTTLTLNTKVTQFIQGSLGTFRAAPPAQQPSIAVQVQGRIEREISSEGKIYLAEERKYEAWVLKMEAQVQKVYAAAAKDIKTLQGLKHKEKNDSKIKALHKRVDQANMFVSAALGDVRQAATNLSAHQGWRGEIFTQDPDMKELLGTNIIKELDVKFKKIREEGVAIISRLSAPREKIEQVHKRMVALSKAAQLAASDSLDGNKVWAFAEDQFRQLANPTGADMGGLQAIKQVMPGMDRDLPKDIKVLNTFIKDAKAKNSKTTPAAIKAYQKANSRKVVTHQGHIDKAKSRNLTVQSRLVQVEKLHKKAPLPGPLVNMLKSFKQEVKDNEKLIKSVEKHFAKYKMIVEGDLAKL